MARIQNKEGFFGMDMDTATAKMQPGDYRFALNIRVGTTDGSNIGHVENIRGNVQVVAPLPSGDNKVIGTYEDDRSRSVIYFVWNSLVEHSIQQYFIETNEIQEVVKGSALNFRSDKLISGVDMISDINEFTDNFNPPRKLNIEKANETEKLREWNLYFPDDAFDFQTGCNYVFTVKDINGVTLAGGYNVCSGPGSPSDDGGLPSGMRNLADDINTATSPGFTTLNTAITAEACGKFMAITSKIQGKITIEIITTDNHAFRLIAQNFYSGALREEYFDLIRYPQVCQPRVEYKSDENITFNFLQRKTFQFRTRFVYDDNEKSVWGSISDLPIDTFGVCALNEESPFNYIEIDFADDRLADDNSLSVITKVDLAVREGNAGIWKKIITLEQADFAFDQTFRFFNNGTYTEISITESDKPFDDVPLKSGALSIIKGRTVLGDNTEGFDVPCVDAKVSIDFAEPVEPETVSTIKGKIRIINPRNNNSDWAYNQPIVDYSGEGNNPVFGGIGGSSITDVGTKYNQALPLKGFTAYLAGTGFSAVSVQDETAALVAGVSILPGSVFDASSASKRGDIKDAMDTRNVFSEFQIENVPDGQYILRLASHSCVKGGGSIFDIDGSGLKYQRTSTRAVDFLGSFTSGSVDFQGSTHELVINIKVGGGIIDIGEIEVEALEEPSLGAGSFAIEGYLFDPEFESADASTIRDRPNMELQKVEWDAGPVDSTDHNGYFHMAQTTVLSGDTFVNIFSIRPDGFTDISGLFIKTAGQALFTGGLTGALTLVSGGEITASTLTTQLILYNHNTDVTSYCRTIVNGKVLDPAGIGVPGMNVVIGQNTRQETTDARGDYSILVYGDREDIISSLNSRTEDVSFSYLGDCSVDLPVGPSIFIDVTPFTKGNDFDNENPFTADNFVVDAFTALLEVVHKRGGNYQYGLEYRDVAGRFTTIATEERLEFYIPFFTEDLNKYFPVQFPTPETFETGASIVTWEIFHDPPPWAVSYRWSRAENTLYNFFLQWVANDVQYVSRFDSSSGDDGAPVVVSFGSSEAKEIYINLENLQFFKDERSDSQLAYVFQTGDRIRIMADETGTFFETFFDFPVKEQRGFDIVIDAENALPELKRGMLFEVYTPKLERSVNFLFEVGPCYDIVNGQHSVTSDVFRNGDAYNRQRVMVAQDNAAGAGGVDRFKRAIESASLSDFYTSEVSGIGRVNIINPDSREIQKGSGMRFGNLFIEDTKINGLSSFDALSSKTLPQEFGAIQKIAFVNNVMLVLFPSKTFSLYINRSMVTDVNGQVLAAQSSDFFSQENELNGDYGTVNPESFVIYKGKAFWWDVFAGAIVQYDSNGTDKINYQMDRYFAKKGRDLLGLIEQSEVVAIYDSYFNQYIVTFRPIADPNAPPDIQSGETVVYQTGNRRRWICFMSFVPQFYGRSGKRIVSFSSDGQLWLHNESDTYNTIYGNNVPSQLRVIANEAPDNIKIWFNMTQRATSPWSLPEITNDIGQLTNLIESDFENKEDDEWHAYLLRDINTPNVTTPLIQGDVMRSRVLELKMEINSDELEVLSDVDVYATPSERTNK